MTVSDQQLVAAIPASRCRRWNCGRHCGARRGRGPDDPAEGTGARGAPLRRARVANLLGHRPAGRRVEDLARAGATLRQPGLRTRRQSRVGGVTVGHAETWSRGRHVVDLHVRLPGAIAAGAELWPVVSARTTIDDGSRTSTRDSRRRRGGDVARVACRSPWADRVRPGLRGPSSRPRALRAGHLGGCSGARPPARRRGCYGVGPPAGAGRRGARRSPEPASNAQLPVSSSSPAAAGRTSPQDSRSSRRRRAGARWRASSSASCSRRHSLAGVRRGSGASVHGRSMVAPRPAACSPRAWRHPRLPAGDDDPAPPALQDASSFIAARVWPNALPRRRSAPAPRVAQALRR